MNEKKCQSNHAVEIVAKFLNMFIILLYFFIFNINIVLDLVTSTNILMRAISVC